MPLDPRAKRFLDMIAVMPSTATTRPPLSERRKALEKLMQFARADRVCGPGVDGAFGVAGRTIPYRLYTPTAVGRGCIVFFHGGGMVAGSIESHDLVCRALAEEASCKLMSI